ncbi:Chitinase A1 [Smittium culicis]|uniref:Chitinase A1 n=1 Tax=Smittium culicis TaxID=133412 RepID=A0A1R1WXT8_9FUNG|nr:Chitinase A1 [Smittium culicis]OMJ23189.1 Chitinase A1 [Smittium culicis]
MSLGFNTIGYLPSWNYYSGISPSNIPAESLTHLVYDTQADFKSASTSSLKGLIGYINNKDGEIRKRNPDLKTIISVGGWAWSKDFSIVARTSESRELFSQSVVDFVDAYGFDGVDIDWEFPIEGGNDGNSHDPSDGVNLVSLLNTIRSGLDNLSSTKYGNAKKFEIGIAVSSSISINEHIDVKAVSSIVDFVNIMGYGKL